MKWQYMTMVVDASGGFMGGKFDAQALTDRLNELGRESWEVVAALDTNMNMGGQSRDLVIILKRQTS